MAGDAPAHEPDDGCGTTAAPLADALDLPLLGHPDAYETAGVFAEDEDGTPVPHPGATSTELQALSERLVLPDGAGPDGWYARPYEGDHEVRAARARALVDGLRDRHDDADVVLVLTHGAFFQHLFRALLGIGEMTGWIVQHNTAISLFEDEHRTGARTVTARTLDWMPHLPDEYVSI